MILPAILVISFFWFLGISLPSYAEESASQAPTQSMEHQNRYETLRQEAIAGGANEKFDAYIYAYEYAKELSEFLPEALGFLIAAAEQEHTYAQYNLGYLLQSGTWIEQNEDAALSWLLLAAKKGHLRAQFWCGMNNLYRYFEAETDGTRAKYLAETEFWFRKVIDSADPTAREVLAAKGKLGQVLISESVTNDEGWVLLKAAATEGYEPALESLIVMQEQLEDEVASGNSSASELLENLLCFLEKLRDSERTSDEK